MTHNVGNLDRVLRIVAGLALIGAALAGVIGPWGWIGLVPLATGLVRVCPAYLPFGISSSNEPEWVSRVSVSKESSGLRLPACQQQLYYLCFLTGSSITIVSPILS